MIDDDEKNAARRATLAAQHLFEHPQPRSASVRVECGARSTRGTSQPHNDDHYLVMRLDRGQETLLTSLSAAEVPGPFEEHGYAMLVANGLGEAGAGAVASRVALSTLAHLVLHFGRWNLRVDPRTAEEIIERAEWYYAQIDAAIAAKAAASPVLANMTTALTMTYSAGDELFVAHVGHTRAYLFRDGALILLTRDQTIEQHNVDSRRPTAVQARAQDLRHVLTHAVGAAGGPTPLDVEQFTLKDRDAVLLCTNGLTDVIDEDRIAEVLALRRQPSEQCALLTDLAAERGAEDNVTVVLAQYQIPRVVA
jgi:serine/threonine protein phosphatase PrpC